MGNRAFFLVMILMLSIFWGARAEEATLNLEESIKLALANNKGLKSSSLGVREAEAKLREEASNFYPRFDLTLHPLPGLEYKAPEEKEGIRSEFYPTISFGTFLGYSHLLPTSGTLSLSLGSELSAINRSGAFRGDREITGTKEAASLERTVYSASPKLILKMSQPILVDGFALARVPMDRAEIELSKARYDREAAGQNVAYDTAIAYYELWRAQEVVELREGEVRQAEETLRITEVNARLGVATPIDVMKARVQLGLAKGRRVDAMSLHRGAADRFRNLLGLDLAVEVKLDAERDEVPLDEFALGEAIDEATRNRLDIKSAELNERLSRVNRTAADGNGKPSLLLGGEFAWTGRDARLSGAFGGLATDSWNISAGVAIPLYDGGGAEASREGAQSAWDRAKLEIERRREEVIVEVRRALGALQGARERVAVHTDNVRLSEETLRADEARYKAGQITGLDLLSTKIALAEARFNLISARVDYNIAKVNLAKAMGLSLAR
ncbi:MAG: TolC family protein [bacterium]